MGGEPLRGREIDQHVAGRGESGDVVVAADIAGPVEAAGDGRARGGGGIGDGAAHPSTHAQYADARHARFMGEPARSRKRNSARKAFVGGAQGRGEFKWLNVKGK